MDNIFIERLWRSLKYEAVYLHERRLMTVAYYFTPIPRRTSD